jgi:hypothetical protein
MKFNIDFIPLYLGSLVHTKQKYIVRILNLPNAWEMGQIELIGWVKS